MNGREADANKTGEVKTPQGFAKIFLASMLCLFAIGAYTLGYAQRDLDIDERWVLVFIRESVAGMIFRERWTLDNFEYPTGREPLTATTTPLYPPLYFFLLKLWTAVLGTSVSSCRAFSLMFAVWSIYLIYRLGAELYSESEGMWASLLLTFSNFHLYYATEIKMYSMVLALSLLSSLRFFRAYIRTDERKDRCMYVLVTLMLTWTFWFAWFLVVGQMVYMVLHTTQRQGRSLKPWLRAFSLLILLALPWVVLVLRYLARNYAEVATNLGTLQTLGARSTSGFIYLFGAFNGMLPLQDSMRYGFLPWSLPFLALIWRRSAFSLRLLVGVIVEIVGTRLDKPTGYMFIIVGVSILSLTAISWATVPQFIPRYLIFCLPAYYLTLSHCAVLVSPKWQHQLLILLPALVWSMASAASPRFLP